MFENAPDVDLGTANLVEELGAEFQDLRWFDLPADSGIHRSVDARVGGADAGARSPTHAPLGHDRF